MRCQHTKSNGERCGGYATSGSRFCWFHADKAAVVEAARRGGRQSPPEPDAVDEIRSIRCALIELARQAAAGEMSVTRATGAGQLLGRALTTYAVEADVRDDRVLLEKIEALEKAADSRSERRTR